jgi:hypothetical protein
MVAKRQPPVRPAGDPKPIRLALHDKAADILQSTAPMKQFEIYVVGFHCAKEDPAMQMEAHHYCSRVNADFIQCVIFDGNTEDANLIGIEYIISEKLFLTLPKEERTFWHPHNYEILSGQLIAPGVPEAAEFDVFKMLMNSYGKTWHTWHTGRHDLNGQDGHQMPMGPAQLMWSFNRDGEGDPAMEQHRNEAFKVDVAKKREHRAEMSGHAHPQEGVDALKGRFPNASEDPPAGVRDAGE